MKLKNISWWLPDPLLGTFGLFGSITSAFHKVESAVKNVVQTVTHPSVKAVEAFITNPLGAQANAAITGPSGVNPVTTAELTAAGAGAIYAGSLALGRNLGIAPAAGVGVASATGAGSGTAAASLDGSTATTIGSGAGAESVLPAATGAINTSLFDPASWASTLGQSIVNAINPAVAGGGTAASGTLPANGTPTSSGLGWLIGGGILLVVVALLFHRK